MELIVVILIGLFVKFINSTTNKADTTSKQQKAAYEMPKRTERVTSPKMQVQQQNAQWQQAARENIEKARQRARRNAKELGTEVLHELYSSTRKKNTAQAVSPSEVIPRKETISATEQIRTGRMEKRSTTILERAKSNTAEGLEDVTLKTMEAEHNHSERVSSAEHYHSEDMIPENMLGTVEDLMVKGYDGTLCFERDFVGEALDMISRFTVPSEVPDLLSFTDNR